ncbi:MAG TPA: xanthine dehydrogenase family protein molybdopterin-binding subunit [Candidatus Lustribacter sp.]
MTSLADRLHSIPSRTDRFAADERRVDGDAKVSGRAQYTADFSRPGMLWAAFVASPHAHARIVAVDAAAARAMSGVHAVLAGADIGEHFFGRRLCDWPVLAIDRVRFIGQYVVAVAADTAEIAAAAAATIGVDYEELPALFDPESALRADAPVLHEHPERYPFMFAHRPVHPHKNIQGYGLLTVGDVTAALASADRVFDHTFTTPRYHGGYVEPRATLVWIDGSAVVHLVSTNKSPFLLRQTFSVCTGVPEERIVVHPSFIGGDFGTKGLSIEEFPCYYLAAATGRPVKCVRSYNDDLRSTNVRHASRTHVRTGVLNDGTIVAQDVNVLFDGGAFAAGKVIPTILPGQNPKLPYRLPNFRLERTAVYTNTIPGCFVRVPGDVQIMFALESSLDMIAAELGIDPLTIRRRNAVSDGDLDIQGSRILEPRATEVLELLERESTWGAPLAGGRGRGLSFTLRHIGIGTTNVQLEPQIGGQVDVRTGSSEPGMGILTVLQRVVAVELGIPFEFVRPSRGDTDVAAFDPGVGASRTTHISGQAALLACRQLRHELEAAACRVAKVADGGLALDGGDFVSRDGAVRVSWRDAIGALLEEHDGAYTVTGHYDSDHAPDTPEYNDFVAYAVEVTVDRETGAFTIDDVVMVADIGTIINPVAHRGQIDGGFVFALGSAITEELCLEDGRIVNPSLADYKLPTIRDVPPFRVALIEQTTGPGPFGARGAGELNLSGVAPAIANAVADACGARITTLPITAERIYAALHGAV